MEKRYYLGIDVGTFSSRGILLDEDFHLVADESVPHGMDNPAPGYFEHDALGVWWGDFCKLSRVLLQRSGISPRQIACVGASALGTDCLPVDENCEPLRPAILYGTASTPAPPRKPNGSRNTTAPSGYGSSSAIPSAPEIQPPRSFGFGGMSRKSMPEPINF